MVRIVQPLIFTRRLSGRGVVDWDLEGCQSSAGLVLFEHGAKPIKNSLDGLDSQEAS